MDKIDLTDHHRNSPNSNVPPAPLKPILLFLFLLGFPTTPAYADGIMLNVVFAVGLMFTIPITLFIVLVEGFVGKWFLGIGFKKAAKIAFIANIVSTLAGIPLMFLERWIFYSQVPRELHLYFKAYFLASLFTYLLFFVVTLLIEGWVWRVLMKIEGIPYTFGKLWKALILGNVLTYAVLCPLHYLFTSPTAEVEELTADTSWAREPTTMCCYIDSETKFLNRVQSNGAERETITPFPMKDYFLSEDLNTCVYRGINGSLYHYSATSGKQSLLSENISDASNQSATAEDKDLMAFVELVGSSPKLKVVPVRALFKLHEEFRSEFGLKDSEVEFLKESATVTRSGKVSFSGFRRNDDGGWNALRFFNPADPNPVYDLPGYWEWVESGEYKVGVNHGPLMGRIRVLRNGKWYLSISDTPGFLRLPKRNFNSPAILENGIEVLVEDGHSIYLIDLENQRIGHLVNGGSFSVNTEVFTKQRLIVPEP